MTTNTVQIDFVNAIFSLLMTGQQDNCEFQLQLKEKVNELGVTQFIGEVATPLGGLVGEKWQENKTHIFIEHFYTSQMNQLLNDLILHNESIYQLGTPKVLLCTVMGERHALGSSMAQALLCNQGAFCINLGSELPISEIVNAVAYYQMNVVGLSFSVVFNKRMMISIVKQLREKLPAHIELWIGGSGAKSLTHIANIKVLISVDEIIEAYRHTKNSLSVSDSSLELTKRYFN